MNLIAAVDKEWGIGNNGDLLIRIGDDLQEFKRLTMGKIVVLGRKTLATFPRGEALKNRTNIIISHDTNLKPNNAIVCNSLEELLDELKRYDSEDIFVVGGASVYNLLLPYCDTAYITKIDMSFDKDTWLPNLDLDSNWSCVFTGEEQESEGVKYYFTKYVVINNSTDEDLLF